MAKFEVVFQTGNFVKATIEAKDEDEARAIAEDMDGADFKAISGTDFWNLYSVYKVTK